VTVGQWAIVGSTEFPERDSMQFARWLIVGAITDLEPDKVISGGAEGIDTLAEKTAVALGYTEADGTMVVHRPKFRRWEPDGFKARNVLIAKDCTHLLRIYRPGSKTYGSGWTADYAERIGRKVWRVPL